MKTHRIGVIPNGVPKGNRVPQGEAGMWGDYHSMELGVFLLREITGEDYPTFFDKHPES